MSDTNTREFPVISASFLLDDISTLLFGPASGERIEETGVSRLTIATVRHGSTSATKEFHEAIKKGMPITVLSRLKEQTQLSDGELAQSLGMSRRTLRRRRKEEGQVLTLSEGDRAFRIARTFAFAKALFGSNKEASKWIRERHIGLGRDIPLDLLQTEAGAMEVEDYLGRMAYSVLS